MPKRFENKVVIVTGAGTGIGRNTARSFAREGGKVIVCGRTANTINETADLILAEGGEARALVADVAQCSDVRRLVAQTLETCGRIDILFNNAGIGDKGKPLCDLDERDFDEIWTVNIKGTWLCMKFAIPKMIETGGGCVVNMSSNAGLVGLRNSGAYSASKHGVIGLTKTAAIEYGLSGIRVNAVAPAAHESAMAMEFKARFGPSEWDARMKVAYPATARMGHLDEISGVVMFLCSDEASNIHGATIPIDGGFTAQ